jgi:hypothetical protein
LSLKYFGVLVGIFRRLHDLKCDLDQTPGKVSNGDELSKSRLQNGLKLSFRGAFTERLVSAC